MLTFKSNTNIYLNWSTHRHVVSIPVEMNQNRQARSSQPHKYPLDPQQRDSLVKLEDNCLVIASAGSGKTSTFFEERFFGGYY